jgi:hypothetical protein
VRITRPLLLIVANNADHALENLQAKMRPEHRDNWLQESNYYADNMLLQGLGQAGTVLLPSYVPQEWLADLTERLLAPPRVVCPDVPVLEARHWPFDVDAALADLAGALHFRAWGPTALTSTLAGRLADAGLLATSYSVHTTRIQSALESKTDFAALCGALSLYAGVRIPTSSLVPLRDAFALIPQLAERWGCERLLIKAPGGIGGLGIFLWDATAPADDMAMALKAGLDADDIFQVDLLLAQEWIGASGRDVAIELEIGKGSLRMESIDMLIADHRYVGCMSTGRLPDRAEAALGSQFAAILATSGYQGWCDLDGIAVAGEFFLLEANVRHTGPSTAVAIRRALAARMPSLRSVLVLDDVTVEDCAEGYGLLRDLLDHIEKITGAMLIPTQVSSLWADPPHAGVAIAAGSADLAAVAAATLLSHMQPTEQNVRLSVALNRLRC